MPIDSNRRKLLLGVLAMTAITPAGMAAALRKLGQPIGADLVGVTIPATGSVPRTVGGKLKDIPHIKDFGAVCDGVADDGQALVMASAALSAGQIKQLNFGDSAIAVSSGARFDVNGASNFAIFGSGAKILFKDGANTRPFVVRNSNTFTVVGLTLDSSSRTTGSYNNLDIMNCSDVWVDSNKFTGANFYGLGVFEDTIGATAAACNNVNITNNILKTCGFTNGIGIECFPKVKSYGLLVKGNILDDCGSAIGASLKAGAGYEQALVTKNLIRNSRGTGISTATWESAVITDNDIVDYATLGIAVSANTHPSYLSPTLASLLVANNRISFSSGSAAAGTSAVSVNGTTLTSGPISVKSNKITRAGSGILCRPTVALDKIDISENIFVDLPKTAPAIYSDAASGSAPANLIVFGNKFVNNDLTRTTAPINLTGCVNAQIRKNELTRAGNQCVALTNCGGAYVEDNQFIEPNPANTASVGCVNVTDSSAVNYYVRRNKIVTGVNGHPKAIYAGNNATPSIYMDGNAADDVSVTITTNSTPTIITNGATPFSQYGKARHFYGTAAPASGGIYSIGDVVWNTAPAALSNIGWVCTAGGSPGTWKTFGTISA